MDLVFEKVTPNQDQIEKLYVILSKKKYSISHNKLPSLKEHTEFVYKNPYVQWYIVYKNKKLFGSFYIHSDNSIGINFYEPNQNDIKDLFKFIKDNHKPLKAIKSTRNGKFFLNIATGNQNLIKILEQLNKKEFQRSFKL